MKSSQTVRAAQGAAALAPAAAVAPLVSTASSANASRPAPDDAMQRRVVELLLQLTQRDGVHCTALEGVRLYRGSQSHPRKPVMYEPSIFIVCQGRKRGFLGDQMFIYDAQQYLVLSVPLPFECETEATPEKPLLAISVRVDLTMVAELLMALDDSRGSAVSEPAGIYATPLDAPLSNAVLRLLEALTQPCEARILGPAIVREICYRVLTGEQGDAIRAALTHQQHFGRIAKALRRIHSDYRGDLDVGLLAAEAGMSLAVFHAHFKAVTSTSPMQYVKTTRLHHARLLITHDGMNVSAAATRVGYESASQFSREFKRLFGCTPADEMRRARGAAEAAAPRVEAPARYVTVV
ncbi:AraC family transcriptional regulator [Paraburkholderia silviterrae]|uniref:AraC family transcriptional regulator n=2 Tax=Paraburkholderia silviterrae TaxID=2528715 RepID=A0A4R5M8Q7_9BURK|nr:AraC family transcriptional regulator [Paraburkholderia silviterrae]